MLQTLGEFVAGKVMANLVCDTVMSSVDAGMLTLSQGEKIIDRIGVSLGVIKTRKGDKKKGLKGRIRARLGTHNVVNIPGPVPGVKEHKVMQDIVVMSYPGHELDAKYVELIIGTKPKFFNVSYVKDGFIASLYRTEGDLEISDLTAYSEALKDQMAIFFFSHTAPENESDYNPFPVIESEGHISLVAYLYGDFNLYKNVDAKHTPASNAWTAHFKPKFDHYQEILDSADPERIYKAMNKSVVIDEMTAAMGENTGLILFSNVEKDLAFEHNEMGENFDWGYVSNTLGFGDKVVVPEPEPEPEPAPKSALDALHGRGTPKASSVPVKPPAPPAPAEKKEVTPVKKEEEPPFEIEGDKAMATATIPATYKELRLPESYRTQNHKTKKKWWEDNLGHPPSNYKEMSTVVKVEVKTGSVPAVKQADKVAPITNAPPKLVIASVTPTKVVPKQPDIAIENIMNAKEKELALSLCVKALDHGSVPIDHPAMLKASEMKEPKFSESVGFKDGLKEMIGYSDNTLRELIKSHPKATLLLLKELRFELVTAWLSKATKPNIIPATPEQVAALAGKYPAKTA